MVWFGFGLVWFGWVQKGVLFRREKEISDSIMGWDSMISYG